MENGDFGSPLRRNIKKRTKGSNSSKVRMCLTQQIKWRSSEIDIVSVFYSEFLGEMDNQKQKYWIQKQWRRKLFTFAFITIKIKIGIIIIVFKYIQQQREIDSSKQKREKLKEWLICFTWTFKQSQNKNE